MRCPENKSVKFIIVMQEGCLHQVNAIRELDRTLGWDVLLSHERVPGQRQPVSRVWLAVWCWCDI